MILKKDPKIVLVVIWAPEPLTKPLEGPSAQPLEGSWDLDYINGNYSSKNSKPNFGTSRLTNSHLRKALNPKTPSPKPSYYNRTDFVS